MKFLNDMALFVEVARVMSFRRAAEANDMPISTVSRRISSLEKAVGLRLLHRTTRKIELTEAGRAYYERCKHIVEEAQLAHDQLGAMLKQPSGVLRVSFPVDFAITYLAPLLFDFSEKFPGIRFDFDLTPRRVDLVSEPYDLAIRMGESSSSNLVARKIATLVPELYASPQYLRFSGVPNCPADLATRECLSMTPSGEWQLINGEISEIVKARSRFQANSVGMNRKLAAIGLGIILTPREIVADELERGTLQRILPSWHGRLQNVYAVTETRLLPAKTQRFVDYLRARLAGEDDVGYV